MKRQNSLLLRVSCSRTHQTVFNLVNYEKSNYYEKIIYIYMYIYVYICIFFCVKTCLCSIPKVNTSLEVMNFLYCSTRCFY